ncbi:Glucuronoyl esterase catalytic domain from Hypocrea Jecorina [Peziza echinospora]|nr:Glucuronoyl esterase catalytic domain from Hypocrea Jecorina [Peziza echinospora]
MAFRAATLVMLALPAIARAACTIGSYTAGTVSELPDPFLGFNGKRIATKEEWTCRREEILKLFADNELGEFPGKPESVTATYSANSLAITVKDKGQSISFSVSIKLPSGGTAPYPAIIAYGGASIPVPAGVATITLNNDDIGAQANTGSRGKGKFFTLYGAGHSASALTAWAWGVSRIIDALELTPAAQINAARIGVTGCSRNGKGAIVAGALEPRVALTIPQESGSGGSACWRLSDQQKKNGQNVQTASQIITENVWFSKSFEPFVNSIPKLPVDHHMLAGLVAPRGLLVIENTSMEWLGNESCFGCMTAGHKIFEALGVPDNMGFSQVGGHDHCQFPGSQNTELNAFINKFLLDKTGEQTTVMKTDGKYTFNAATWTPWTAPSLS